jgi:acetyl esterase
VSRRPHRARWEKVRIALGAFVVDNAFRGISYLGRLHPNSKPARHRVEVERDVAYVASGRAEHLLDVYRPIGWETMGKLPVVLYTHGGGFRFLSKDTHWIMGLAFARRGFLVFNISYRLAPQHPYPAALEDACRAYLWVVSHAARYGGDPDRIIVAGESAGANLATALTVAACFKRPEPWARGVYDVNHPPVAALPACGILQVSDPTRFKRRRRHVPQFVSDRVEEVSDAYLGDADSERPGGLELADPLCILESDTPADRSLPPFYVSCGTKDVLLDDTRRLEQALHRRGARCKVTIFPGEMHAFHAMIWRPAALQHWRESFEFLKEHLV